MRSVRLSRWRWLRWSGGAILFLIVLAAGGFGLLQTSIGEAWLSRIVAGSISAPGASVAIDGLGGTVPFHMHAMRITVADARGTWLTLHNVDLDLSAGGLLAGRAHVRSLTAAALDIARPPEATVGSAAAPSPPLSEQLRIPRLPLALTVDRLAVERIVLDAPVLGTKVEATFAGAATLVRESARIQFDLHRIDGAPGSMELELGLAGAGPTLNVKLTASDPTGILVDNLLHRDDHLPFSASLRGAGPLSDWHGRLEVSAGARARFDADVTLAGHGDAAVTVSGAATLASLLPSNVVPLIGEHVPVALGLTFKQTGAILLDSVSIGLAAGKVTGDAALGNADRSVAAHLRASFPNLAAASGIAGMPIGGSAEVKASVSGTEQRPVLQIDIGGDNPQVASAGAEHADGHLTVAMTGNPGDPAARVEIAAQGRIRGITTQGDVDLPSELGRNVDWSLTVSAARDGSMVELTRFAASGAGLEFSGSGHLRPGENELNGRVQLAIADLRPFTSVFGRPLDGALTLGVTAEQLGPDRTTAEIEGSVTGLRTGIPAIDALAGSSIAITASAQRNPSGFAIDCLTVAGSGFSAEGTGQFERETRQLAATLNLGLPRLQPLGTAVRAVLGGRVSTQIKAGGTLDHPSLRAHVEGVELAVNGAKLNRLRLDADVADISEPKVAVDGEFQGTGIDGSLALEADATDRTELLIPRLRLKAAGGAIEAQLRIARGSLVTRGSVSATMPDLSRWSRLLGVPLTGSLDLKAGLDARSGQSLDLTMNADHLTSGAGPSQVALRHLAITARLNDLLGMPAGKAQATLTAASFLAGGLANTNLTIDSTRRGHFAFAAETKGKLAEPLAVALGGECDLAPHDAGIEIRLTRLTGSIGSATFQLRQPLILAKRGSDLSISDLALSLGGGLVHGNAALRGGSLSAQFTARDLSVAAIARPAGFTDASGTLNLEASLSGTIAAPRGRFTLSGQALRIALQKQPRLPTVALNADGSWNGHTIDVKGRVAEAKSDALDFTASAPLVLSAAPLTISMPPQGSLSAHIQGAGDFANLADLLPLGEDRLTGHFAIDVSASGTLAAPAAAGHLTVSNGRYESFATGAVLTHLRVDLAGDRDRFSLREFAADDAAGGNVAARGSLVLGGGAGPTADFSANLTNLRVAARDEAVVNATGTIIVSGPIVSPKVSGDLAITSGDFTIPTSLPPTVARLDVVETRSKTGTPPPAKATSPALSAALDVTITVPDRVFVRGHGLDSEWRGKLKINGTSAVPQIVGALDAVRGTFAVLGKSFQVTRGKIAFAGGSKLDPTLDIVAELSAAEITAQILVGGMASSPKITLTSTPAVPQDEILARVLFNNSVGQITPAEGIEVAQAAATLAGGGPDVVDRLRGRLGLDRLGIGSAPTGIASSNLNPAAGGGSATSGTTTTAVSGGKYVAEGVYVGATQGATPQSSAVTVEIEVHRHVTVETDLSQTNGNGIGLNYKLDY